MGINGLWKLLEPAVQNCTLNDLSLENGYSATNKKKIPHIGVDTSVVMNECVAANKAIPLYQQKSSGELLIFFFKLCKFLRRAPAIMIFIFDGPNRPSFKHGRHIDTHTIPAWSDSCKSIIDSCGFYWHQAPGEAEAELAMLSRYNAIDAVLTSDSDALVFGAQCVIKSIRGVDDEYLLYSMDMVEHTTSISPGGLLLIALLSKGDYSDGLIGCSPQVSASLARCGFGDQILHAVHKLEDMKLLKELEIIAAEIKAELRNNSRGFLHSRYPMLAAKFSVEFITPDKISVYLNPIVSPGIIPSHGLPPSAPIWLAKEPNIPRIRQFCVDTLKWKLTTLGKHLENILWPGVFLRTLTSPLLVYKNTDKLCFTPNSQVQILSASIRSRTGHSGNWARVEYSTNNFLAALGVSNARKGSAPKPKMKVWVSAKYLPVGLLPPLLSALPPGALPHLTSLPCSPPIPNTPGPSNIQVSNAMEQDLDLSWSCESAASSPDPPSVEELLNSTRLIHKATTQDSPALTALPKHKSGQPLNKTQTSEEVLELTDSESEIEILHSAQKRAHSEAFSPEVIVISD